MHWMTTKALNQVTLCLYREGRDVQLHKFQDWALEQVKRVIGFDSAWWGNAAMKPIKIHWLHLYNCDASILEAYPTVQDCAHKPLACHQVGAVYAYARMRHQFGAKKILSDTRRIGLQN